MPFRINIKIFVFFSVFFLLISCMHVMDLNKMPVSTIGLWCGVRTIGNVNADVGDGIAIDSLGNIILIGSVTGAVDLNGDGDTSDGSVEDATGYGNTDIFISKYDASGNWVWSKRLGWSAWDSGYSVAVDSNDNIIATGRVNGDVDLNGDGDNSDGGAEDSTGYGNSDIFISKFDSSGNWLWAERLGGTDANGDWGYSVTVDSSNSIIVAGVVSYNADLNGDGDMVDGAAETSVGYGIDDLFISKFDSSGAWQWSRRLGGFSNDRDCNVITDDSNNVIVAGTVKFDADCNGDGDRVDGGAEDSTNYGSYDVIISKFDSSGVWQWAKRLGGAGWDEGAEVCTDSSGSVIVIGKMNDATVDVNGDGDMIDGSLETNCYGGDDIILSKFDALGNWMWGKRLGGSSTDFGYTVITDSSDNIIVSGIVIGNVDLNGDGDNNDGGAEGASGYGGADVFVTKFDVSGNWLLAKRLGGTGSDYGYDLAANGSTFVLTGKFESDADLDGDGIKESTSAGSSDVFFTRF